MSDLFDFDILKVASDAQRRATMPGQAAWVVANAGTGKTKVLTDRVTRLLLEDVPPERILCLTFTKAAAAEMRNRLAADIFSEDERPLEELILDAARARGATIATAESCTAGLVATRLTDIAGSSDVVLGGIVAYATCLGEFGAVITFAANIPGQTQTLPLAIYAALQVPGGEAKEA